MSYTLCINAKKTFGPESKELPLEVYVLETLADVFRKAKSYSDTFVNSDKLTKLSEWHQVIAIDAVIFQEFYKSRLGEYYLLTYSIYEAKDKE